jgi:transposase
LIKRLRRHRNDLFTFLDQPNVPFDNNLAERSIRPAVIIRKNSYGNRSDQGADTQAILMSVFFTLKKRGHHPIQTIYDALTTYLKTGQLPPLPAPAAANG